MGANISKIKEDSVIVDNDVEPITSSCSSSQTESISVQEPQASSSSVPLTPSIESSQECHRLPPVESRASVQYQASCIGSWQAVDDAGELYESRPFDQCSATQSADQNGSSEDMLPYRFSTRTQSLQIHSSESKAVKQSASPSNRRGLSPLVEQPKEKRHLVLTGKAVEIALYRSDSSQNHFQQSGFPASSPRQNPDILEESAGWSFSKLEESTDIRKPTLHGSTFVEDGFPSNNLDQENFPLYQDEDFDSNEHLNEGGTDLSLPAESSEHQEDEKLIRDLTLMQPENIVLFKAVRAFDQLPSRLDDELEDEHLRDARQWMLRDQAEGAERSRMLREKALQRRGLHEPFARAPLFETESPPSHCENMSSPPFPKDDSTPDAVMSDAGAGGSGDVLMDQAPGEQELYEENTDRDLNRVQAVRTMSGLDLLAVKRGDDLDIHNPSKTDTRGSNPKASISAKTGPDITLPANFDTYGEEEQSIVVNHETAKERKRDLDAIERAMYWIGYLRCCAPFNEKDRHEVNQLRKFIGLIVDERKSNRFTRRQVQDIRDKMKRRAVKYQTPYLGDISGWQARLFPGRFDRVKEEMEKADEQVQQFGALRLDKTVKRKHGDRKHRTKKVRFTDAAEHRQTRAPKGTADQLRERLKKQLKVFHEVPEVTDLPEQTKFLGRQQSDSEESEEDEGAQFVYGAGRNTASFSFTTTADAPNTPSQKFSPDIDEVNRLENARQRNNLSQGAQSVAAAGATSQAFDSELLKMMQAKRALHDLGIDPAVVKANTGPQEAVDSASETSDSSDEERIEEDQQVFQYTVLGSFAGIPSFKDGDDYVFKKTFDSLTAETRLKQVIQDVSTQYAPQGGYQGGNWSLNTRYRHGLIEQYFTIGEDADVEARVWIEKEQIDIDKKLFRLVKARRFGIQNIHYTVEWEKTVSPVLDETNGDTVDARATVTSTGNASVVAGKDEDDLDSLFGDDSTTTTQHQKSDDTPAPIPSRHLGIVTTTMPREEMKTYTTPVLANRHAKDYYMEWYARFFPGVANEGYRRMEDEAVEKELESMGTWGLWSREESFTRRVVAHRDDDDEMGLQVGDEKVQEKFKVWVRKVEVLGPRN